MKFPNVSTMIEQSIIDQIFENWRRDEYPYAHPVQDRPAFDAGFYRGYQLGHSERVYREGTPLSKILCESWMRGFLPTQVVAEAKASGFIIDIQLVEFVYRLLDSEYENIMKSSP